MRWRIGSILGVLMVLSGVAHGAAVAQHWAAASQTAMAITGDITLTPDSLTFANGTVLHLQPAGSAPGTDGLAPPRADAARLYRVRDPRPLVLLHGNALCRATYVGLYTPAVKPGAPQDLYVAFYTGDAPHLPAQASRQICDSPYWFEPAPAIRAGFDCARAASVVEKAICADAGSAELDRQMAAAFSAVLRRDPQQAGIWRASQRRFLALRNACAAPERGHPPSQAALYSCIGDLTRARRDALRRAGDDRHAAAPWIALRATDEGGQVQCAARSGADGSDTLLVQRRPGTAGAGRVIFAEFAAEGVGVLRPGDTAGFAVDGAMFPAQLAIDPPSAGPDRRFRILAGKDDAALVAAMKTGRELRVLRNAKTVFLAPLAGFAPIYAKAMAACPSG